MVEKWDATMVELAISVTGDTGSGKTTLIQQIRKAIENLWPDATITEGQLYNEEYLICVRTKNANS